MRDLAGTGHLIRLILRRDRLRLPIWIVALVGTVLVVIPAVKDVYGTPDAIAAYALAVGSSAASIAFSGPPVGLDSIAGVVVFETNMIVYVGISLMAIFLVVRHTRGEEEAGRTEMLRATVLGRYAPIAAAVLVVSAACVIVGAGISVAFASQGLPAGGSVVFGASAAAAGIVFTVVGALAAQLTIHARGALGIGGLVLAVAWVLRALGDISDNWLSWLSPIGWSQATHPFADDRWWPLLVSAAFVVVAGAATVGLARRRDLGAGLIADRTGPAEASSWLATPVALAVRQQRVSVIAWTVGIFALGLTLGSLGDEVRELVEGNPALGDMLGGGDVDDLVDAFLATSLLMLALLAGGFAISSALRLRVEEDSGRAESVLATAVSRWRWAGGSVAVTAVAVTLALALAGLGTGVSRWLDSGDSGAVGRLTLAALAYTPAVLLLAALAVLLWGFAPRLALAAWGVFALCFGISYFGDLLKLPSWALDLSPFTHVGNVPADPANAPGLALLGVLALACAAVGVWGFSRRDVG